MTREELQAEHRAWIDAMYPGQPIVFPLAGMVEEAGELLHAVLAEYREMRYGPDGRHSDLHNDIVDAVGDCGVYVCSYCNAASASFRTVWDTPEAKLHGSTLDVCAKLCMQASSNMLSTHPDVHSYVSILKQIASEANLNVWPCVVDTWKRVRERRRATCT
jgi:NTP pyrophosphatase (non-canonical NTP hydrolase)